MDPGHRRGAAAGTERSGCCMSRSLLPSLFAWAWSILLAGATAAQAQSEPTVLRTGSGQPLLTHSLDLLLPGIEREPTLLFEFGFATDEINLPEAFFDSFSVTLQPTDAAKTALLLTMDTTGLVRAPYNPGGLVLTETAIDLQSVGFPDLSPTLALQAAFTVSFNLPGDLAGEAATVYFDLFDNQNPLASLAYVRNVHINALPPIGQPADLRVWSARSPLGPYVEQNPLEIDLENQSIRFVPGDPKTYFMLQSTVRARILHLSADAADWIITYTFDPVTLILESALDAAGPYVPETATAVDVIGQTIRLPAPDATRFYRLRSEAAITLSAPRWETGALQFDYALPPLPVALLSSAAPTGPYVPEIAARQDSTTRTIRIQKGGSSRFFQLTADRALRIHTLSRENGQLILTFDLP